MNSNVCVSRTFGLEVTNSPGTAKDLASNLTGICFFFKLEIFRFKKVVGLLFVCICFAGLVAKS